MGSSPIISSIENRLIYKIKRFFACNFSLFKSPACWWYSTGLYGY